jgi:hypothetical protein
MTRNQAKKLAKTHINHCTMLVAVIGSIVSVILNGLFICSIKKAQNSQLYVERYAEEQQVPSYLP